MPMSSALHFEREQLLKTSLPVFVLILLLPIASAGAEEAARGDGAADQAQKQIPQSEKLKEEFKINYKKPKQRHDDDEAPVPKFGKSPQPDSTAAESPGPR
jgi:hypothetical protein